MIEVNPGPRPRPTRPPVELQRPAADPAARRQGVPWLAMVLPLAVAVPVCVLTRQPMFLLFALMSPVMILGSTVSERTRGRRERDGARADLDRRVAGVEAALTAALRDDLSGRRADAPDAAELLRCVSGPSARLWERGVASPDVLRLLLGSGRVEARVRVRRPDGTPEQHHLDDAPVTVALRDVGHLGLAGDRARVLAVGRHLVTQVAAWHSPRAVRLVVLGSDVDWGWTRWLPHLIGDGPIHDADDARAMVSALQEHAERHGDEPGAPAPGSWTVLVVDHAGARRSLPGLADLMVAGPPAGIHTICLDDDLSGLAGECRATFDVHPTGARLVTDRACVEDVTWDGVTAGLAERVARALCPMRDAAPHAAAVVLPTDVRLLDLLDVDATDPADIIEGWNRCPAGTVVTLGVGPDGPTAIDLRQDGPHVLVAGTTGAGKSELLQTLIAGLAVTNRPDELSFVLVDYKGGAAFGGCAELPHTAGLVTDLDEHLAERALTSLGAELGRRERLLRDAGCADIEAYQRLRAEDRRLPPIPRLVVAIDEFRMLAEELPEFVSGLVRVAAVGRSLGVHLVLATQRPAGIVTADIKANMSLRIALRLRDRSDSDDVLDAPDAAGIDATTPGRALSRNGSGALALFQVARVNGSRAADDQPIRVRRIGDPLPPTVRSDDDLAHVVDALREATRLAGVVPHPPAWLAPLPAVVRLGQLDRTPAAGGGVAIGLVDLPAEQRQPVLTWDPRRDGHLGLCGGPRSGRTRGVLSIALSLAVATAPDDLHLHVVDAASGHLKVLAALPHTGTVLSHDEPRLVARLVDRLAREVRRRLDEPRSPRPTLVLLVDGWDALVESLDAADHGRTSEALSALLRDGPAAGLHVVVTGHRALLTSRLTAVVPDRLLLRVSDTTDLLLAGLPASAATSLLPGRGVRTRDGAAVQLALADVDETVAEVRRTWLTTPTDQLRVRELPTSVSLDQLTRASDPGDGVLLGVGGDEGRPVRLDLTRHRLALVGGSPGSGRSTTLLTLARGLRAVGVPVLAVCPRPSPLDAGPWPVLTSDDAPGLAEHLARDPALVVLVDDAELLDPRVDEALDAQARHRGPAALVLAGTTAGLLGAYRGAAATVRSARTGVLLAPTPADGELLGVRTEPADRPGPGRGVLVVAGDHTPLQVAR
ncbi:MAG: FtsK/SpoIIIE domain-containing protein [Actinomycetota bacterium]